jgi:hypothetical protein
MSVSFCPTSGWTDDDFRFVFRYTAEQLRTMPLNTVMDYRDRLPMKRPESPPAITVDERKIEADRARAAERAGDTKAALGAERRLVSYH